MTFFRLRLHVVCVLAAPLLAACGGGGGGAGAGGGTRTFAANTPSLDNDARAFAAGRTYSSTSRFVQVSGRNTAAFDETVEMRTDADGNLVLSINASDHTLSKTPPPGAMSSMMAAVLPPSRRRRSRTMSARCFW